MSGYIQYKDDVSLNTELSLSLPVAAWMAIMVWYTHQSVLVPELNLLSDQFSEAVIDTAYLKARQAEHAESHSMSGVLAKAAREMAEARLTHPELFNEDLPEE